MDDTLEINRISATGLAAPRGELGVSAPVDLAGVEVVIVCFDRPRAVLPELSLGERPRNCGPGHELSGDQRGPGDTPDSGLVLGRGALTQIGTEPTLWQGA